MENIILPQSLEDISKFNVSDLHHDFGEIEKPQMDAFKKFIYCHDASSTLEDTFLGEILSRTVGNEEDKPYRRYNYEYDNDRIFDFVENPFRNNKIVCHIDTCTKNVVENFFERLKELNELNPEIIWFNNNNVFSLFDPGPTIDLGREHNITPKNIYEVDPLDAMCGDVDVSKLTSPLQLAGFKVTQKWHFSKKQNGKQRGLLTLNGNTTFDSNSASINMVKDSPSVFGYIAKQLGDSGQVLSTFIDDTSHVDSIRLFWSQDRLAIAKALMSGVQVVVHELRRKEGIDPSIDIYIRKKLESIDTLKSRYVRLYNQALEYYNKIQSMNEIKTNLSNTIENIIETSLKTIQTYGPEITYSVLLGMAKTFSDYIDILKNDTDDFTKPEELNEEELNEEELNEAIKKLQDLIYGKPIITNKTLQKYDLLRNILYPSNTFNIHNVKLNIILFGKHNHRNLTTRRLNTNTEYGMILLFLEKLYEIDSELYELYRGLFEKFLVGIKGNNDYKTFFEAMREILRPYSGEGQPWAGSDIFRDEVLKESYINHLVDLSNNMINQSLRKLVLVFNCVDDTKLQKGGRDLLKNLQNRKPQYKQTRTAEDELKQRQQQLKFAQGNIRNLKQTLKRIKQTLRIIAKSIPNETFLYISNTSTEIDYIQDSILEMLGIESISQKYLSYIYFECNDKYNAIKDLINEIDSLVPELKSEPDTIMEGGDGGDGGDIDIGDRGNRSDIGAGAPPGVFNSDVNMFGTGYQKASGIKRKKKQTRKRNVKQKAKTRKTLNKNKSKSKNKNNNRKTQSKRNKTRKKKNSTHKN